MPVEQYRFGPMQARHLPVLPEGSVQHLADHYSGAWRGTVLRMGCNGRAEFGAGLAARQYVHALPGIARSGCGPARCSSAAFLCEAMGLWAFAKAVSR